jgi:hypothetical protein
VGRTLETTNINLSQHQINPSIMSASKSRTIILTGGVAAITAMGAWYGATLKTDREVRQVRVYLNFAFIKIAVFLPYPSKSLPPFSNRKNRAHTYVQAKKEIIEATPEEKIERLEMAKARLMTRRTELENKIGELRKKQEIESS